MEMVDMTADSKTNKSAILKASIKFIYSSKCIDEQLMR